jgi:hypothetical protein
VTRVLFASHIERFLACEHLAELDRRVDDGLLEKPYRPDPALELRQERGRRHEREIRERLARERGEIADIPQGADLDGRRRAAAATLDAMRAAAPVIYQGVLFDGAGGPWGGQPDFLLRTAGPTLSAFNAWVLLKGLETLQIRMEAQSAKALLMAQWLEAHPKVARVFYPGLPSHPQHALAMRKKKNGGGIVSFDRLIQQVSKTTSTTIVGLLLVSAELPTIFWMLGILSFISVALMALLLPRSAKILPKPTYTSS